MKFYELKHLVPDWQSVKMVSFEWLDCEEYEMARYDGKNYIPNTFDNFEIQQIDTESENYETFLKIRVDTNGIKINQLIFSAYVHHEFSKAVICSQYGEVIDSCEIPNTASQEWIDNLLNNPVYKTYFEAVTGTGDSLEFIVYREDQ